MLKKIRDNFRVYLEHAHPAFLTTIVVLVLNKKKVREGFSKNKNYDCSKKRRMRMF